MSQILLPPPSQPSPDPAATPAPEALPALPAPAPAPRSRYEPEPPKPPSPIWRAVKWPLRQFFKLLYLLVSAARRHRIATVLTIVLLAVLGGVAYGAYQYTHPTGALGPTSSGQPAQGSGANGSSAPFTIISQQPPLLPASIIHWLHGHKVFDAREMWSSLSSQAQGSLQQQGVTMQTLQSQLDREKSAGLSYDQYIYTGGFAPPGNNANFTVQVIVSQNGQSIVRTWYFIVDPNGQIVVPLDINTLLGQ